MSDKGSMKTKQPFNKKIFALLIEKAKGDRTVKQFANDCGISYVQLHKLELGAQENAPGIKLITKLAQNSAGGIELEDYLLAAGKNSASAEKKAPKKRRWISRAFMKACRLPSKKRYMILWTISQTIKSSFISSGFADAGAVRKGDAYEGIRFIGRTARNKDSCAVRFGHRQNTAERKKNLYF